MAKSTGKKIVKGIVARLLVTASLCTIGNSISDYKEKKDAEKPDTEITTETENEVE